MLPDNPILLTGVINAGGKVTNSTLTDSLHGQVALVTGGSKGIGASIAEKLASMGANVIICGRNQADLDRETSKIKGQGGRCTAVSCDVARLESVQALADHVGGAQKQVDILVNNAGVGGFGGPLHQLSPEHWDAILNTNLRGVYHMIRAFAPVMIERKSGHIINISSLAGKNALPNGAAYAASKWGLNGLTYSVAEELRSYNIRVSVVCPGSVDTDLSPHQGKKKERMLQGEDVAHAVVMLVTQAPRSFISEVLIRPTQKP
jgi:NAD(P)-dependent dehydrogenase (short-subunit alcohol dehydrogenase family)